ncbi:MAG: autotransporter assembly complex family protein [Rhodospirillales bacterium]
MPALLAAAVLSTASLPAVAQAPETAYSAGIESSEPLPDGIEERLGETALTFRLKDNPPPTRAGLDRRAESDIDRMVSVMRSAGYYDSSVSYTIADPPEGPIEITFKVEAGPPYLIADILLATDNEATPKPVDDRLLDRLGITVGEVARAERVVDAESLLARSFREDGYPFAEVTGRKARIDTADKTMNVTFTVKTGGEQRFGSTAITGLVNVTESHVRDFIRWQPGQPYDIRLAEDTQRRLEATGLFASVAVQPAGGTAQAGEADMRINLAERAHRSIGFGARFSTGEGLAGNIFWEHRNLFNEGEKLRISAVGSLLERGFSANFSDPLEQDPRRNLVVESEIKSVRTDAYADDHGAVFAGIEQALSERWTATAGPTLEYYDIRSSENFDGGITLVGLRGNLGYDSTDSRLNPTEGARLRFGATPYTSFGASDASFLLGSMEASAYQAFDADGDFVMAARTRLAATAGASRRAIPPSKRYYAGGGGSVRGYEFQTVGPLDEENEPVGGRSAAEIGLELRLRLTDTIGIVPFVEGGNVYTDSAPDLANPHFLWGAGLGLRYYTDFGPIRFDIATPINERDVVDKPVQFYVSFGQAF